MRARYDPTTWAVPGHPPDDPLRSPGEPHDGSPPGLEHLAADAVPTFGSKGQENAHEEEDPASEQEWLGNQTKAADTVARLSLLRIERTATRALDSVQNGNLPAAITHLRNALALAEAEQAYEDSQEEVRP